MPDRNPTFETNNREVLRKVRVGLNADFKRVLEDMKASNASCNQPEGLVAKFGWLKYFPSAEAILAGIVEKLVGDNDVIIIVSPSESQLFQVGPYIPNGCKSDDGRVIAATFPELFYERCNVDGVDSNDAIKRSISQVVWWDVKMKGEKTQRIKYPRKEKDFIVQIGK